MDNELAQMIDKWWYNASDSMSLEEAADALEEALSHGEMLLMGAREELE